MNIYIDMPHLISLEISIITSENTYIHVPLNHPISTHL